MNNYIYEVIGAKNRSLGVYKGDLCSEEEMKIKAVGIFIGAKMFKEKIKVTVSLNNNIVYQINF